MTDSVISKLQNCKLTISNIDKRRDDDITKKVKNFNIRYFKFRKKNKIGINDNTNLDV